MNPDVTGIQPSPKVAHSQSQVGPAETLWKGRVFSLNCIDVQARRIKIAAAIVVIAGILLGLVGFVWIGLALGIAGAVAAIGTRARKFTPDKEHAYRLFAINAGCGSDRNNPFIVNFDNKDGTISIHLTQKELDEASKDAGLLVGKVREPVIVKGVHRGDIEDQLFVARVNNRERQIKIFPETLEASRLKYNVIVDNIPIEVGNEAIPCFVNDKVIQHGNYSYEYKYDFMKLYVKG